ncbi:actin-like protein ARP8 [Panicum miliaceum]|uniref:Actin-like protein ARP8 n=1 Tax=Panicum miliaceum TaxID=4540 RepID=A0A3L6P951_PANMI|nr:actin-like protein ARP8 [Panicum miliaceum]
MGRSRGEPSGQWRQKCHHDPHVQREEESPPSPIRELRPRCRPGKEPAGSSDQARQAPYIMRSMPVPPPSHANPSKRGVAWEICPQTPPRLQIEFAPDQRQYPWLPKLATPGSFIKRALKSIFCMCKSMSQEVNENCRDIIEIKSHLGLPYDPYHELPDFDDPFAEWDAADEATVAAAHAPLLIHAALPLLALVVLLHMAKKYLMKRADRRRRAPQLP